MRKHNFLDKKLKKQFLSINNSIESYFNRLKNIRSNIKKLSFDKDIKVFFTIAILIILSLSYFLIPTFYDQEIVKQEIKNQILNKYNIDVKFNEKLSYSILPKPHYGSKNLLILKKKEEIGQVKDLKIFISVNKFFSLKSLEIRDLVLNKTDFSVNKDNLNFFKDLLKTKPSKNKIIIKNSNIFFKNKDDELMFINKINKSKFYYDSNNLVNILSSKNEIFNIPFSFKVKNDEFNKKIFSEFKSKKIRLNVENELNYEDKVKNGLLDILLLNKDTSLKYNIKDNLISFQSDELKYTYNGIIELKPFYLTANFDYEGISTKNFLNDNSLFFDIIKSEILNNSNLSTSINLKVKKIVNIEELNDLLLKITIEEGKFILSNSNIMWKDDLKITLKESLLNYDENEINLTGKFIIDIVDLKNFYRSFQIKKKSRKKIDRIEFDFYYNFDQKEINFDNIKIDNNTSLVLDKFITRFNNNEKKFINKIMFKNFVSKFFDNYDG